MNWPSLLISHVLFWVMLQANLPNVLQQPMDQTCLAWSIAAIAAITYNDWRAYQHWQCLRKQKEIAKHETNSLD